MKRYAIAIALIVCVTTTFGKSQQAINKDLLVKLYEEPKSNSTVVTELPVNADLVAIYHQNSWVKVGDRANGATGWIDLRQYKDAKRNFYQHYFSDKIDSVYLRKTVDKNGHVVIEAYKDGKKLSEAEAQKLYIDLQTRERHQWEAIQRFNQVTDAQMSQEYLDARRALDEAFAPPPGKKS